MGWPVGPFPLAQAARPLVRALRHRRRLRPASRSAGGCRARLSCAASPGLSWLERHRAAQGGGRRLVDELDPAARRIGAVNTVLVLDDGRTRGLNTDGARLPRQSAPGARPPGVPAQARRWCWAPAARRGRWPRHSSMPACRRLRLANRTGGRARQLATRARRSRSDLGRGLGERPAMPSPTRPCWSTAPASA